jgi:CheY-like chemotaxis protein
MSGKPLAGLSILVVDDDVLGGFRTRVQLMGSGARVAVATSQEAIPYLTSPHLKAVVVGTLIASREGAAFRQALAKSRAPWVGYGAAISDQAERAIPAGDFRLLEAALQVLCGEQRH